MGLLSILVVSSCFVGLAVWVVKLDLALSVKSQLILDEANNAVLTMDERILKFVGVKNENSIQLLLI